MDARDKSADLQKLRLKKISEKANLFQLEFRGIGGFEPGFRVASMCVHVASMSRPCASMCVHVRPCRVHVTSMRVHVAAMSRPRRVHVASMSRP